MNGVKFLEKLLNGAKVEWLPLGDITQYEQPTKYLVKTKNYNDAFDTPVLTAGKTFVLGYTDETEGINKASENPVIIFDDFTTARKWVDFDFKAKSSAMKIISSSDDSKFILKYVYYWLNTLPNNLVDGDHKRQWISNFCNKKIPIPCPDNPKKSLEIQTEIVRILDRFTELTAELTAELTDRQQQYEYYRHQLFDFKNGDVMFGGGGGRLMDNMKFLEKLLNGAKVEWVALGDVIKLEKGRQLNKELLFTHGLYPAYNGGVSYSGFTNTFNYTENKTIISQGGASAGFVNFVTSKFYANAHCYVVLPNAEIINNRYIYHLLKLNQEFLTGKQHGAGIPALRSNDILKISIPLPCPDNPKRSLEIQTEIVRILDQFTELTAELTAELADRQQQYEYYRQQLLDFPTIEK